MTRLWRKNWLVLRGMTLRVVGISSPEDDEDDDEDGGVENREVEEEEFPDMQAEQAGVEMGEVSSRFAVVNLGLDNIKSTTDLNGRVLKFRATGWEDTQDLDNPANLEKENGTGKIGGPPKEIFARKQEEESPDPDSEDDSEDGRRLDEKIKKTCRRRMEVKNLTAQHYDSTNSSDYDITYAVVVCSR